MQGNRHWVGTWAASPAPSESGVAFNNHTLRMNPRISLGGERLRVRISNAYGNRPLAIGAARIALRDKGPAAIPGSDRKLTFGGSDGATIAAGAVLFSDPVDLNAPALADLAVSIHLPGEVLANFSITGRYAQADQLHVAAGRFHPEAVMPVGSLSDQWYFLSGVDVLAGSEAGGVVALGDSLTDGNISTIDAYCRWPDQLARRLIARRAPDGGDEPGARRQPHPLRSARRQRSAPLRPRRPGPARGDPRDRHARHQRSAQPLGQARGGGDRRADDRRAPADGAARARRAASRSSARR